MTLLARDLSLMRIPFDSWRLFTATDPYYERWLGTVLDRVVEANRQAKKTSK